MFNVAVVNVKDLMKYLVGLILAVFVIIVLTRYFSLSKAEGKSGLGLKDKEQAIRQKSYVECLDETIPAIEEKNDPKVEHDKEFSASKDSMLENLLNVELSQIDTQSLDSTNTKENDKIDEAPMQEASINQGTEVVTPIPINVQPTDTYGNVQIRNQTSYVLTEDVLKPEIEVNNSNIVIFHTHTCESYTPTEQNQYEASGAYRTIDLNYSVARVGDELTNYLSRSGYNVLHDKTYHDYPAYTGSYARSLKTVEELLKNIESDVVIDLHRDAVGSNSDYAPTVRIGDDYAAQLMFVIGTDGGGLFHPNWNQNLKFAVAVQQKAEELYPGLFKPIILRNSRYNQHVAKAATIIEVGATGNTLEQCLTSMKYLSKVLDETIN